MAKSLTNAEKLRKSEAKMQTRKYDIMLDVAKTEELRRIAKSNGQTLSGLVRLIIAEYVDTVEYFKKAGSIPDDMSQLTVGQFAELFTGMITKMKAGK